MILLRSAAACPRGQKGHRLGHLLAAFELYRGAAGLGEDPRGGAKGVGL
jgi:hypothetical protein